MFATWSAERLEKEFAAFVVGDATDKTELISRYAVVLGTALALWYTTGSIIMPIWGFGYVAINTVYVQFLKRKRAPFTGFDVFLALSSSAFVAAWYCAMVIYLGIMLDGQLLFLAICGCIGLALHCLSRNAGFTLSAYVDFCATAVTTACVFGSAYFYAQSTGLKIATAVGGIGIMGYFWISFVQIISERNRLSQRLEAEALAQKMQALGQLTGGIAHDFNNLLTVVRGNIELYQMSDSERGSDDHLLEEAKDSVDRGAKLVRQLLAYTQNSQFQRTHIELNELMLSLEVVLKRTLPSNISLQVTPCQSERIVEGDISLLESAVLNLVINARDAIGSDTGRITVELVDAGDTAVMIQVSDTGPGMSDQVIAHATEPFFSTKDFGRGSGLGLSMVKGLAEQMGGYLALENGRDRGLVATIGLPRNAAAG